MAKEIDDYADVEVSSEESSALARLSGNKDYLVLVDIMARWQMKSAYDLISATVEGQETDLLLQQGGYRLYKRMVKYVQEALDSAPRKRNG